MGIRTHSRRYAWVTLALAIPLLLACGVGSSVAVSPTNTATPGPTATPAPPPHAIAWVQGSIVSHTTPQVWASINDGPPTQITGLSPSNDRQVLGPPMFSPDLAHIAVATGAVNVDSPFYGKLLIVTVAGGVVATPSLPGQVLTNERGYGWVDNTTVFYLGSQAVEYNTANNATTNLPGISNAVEGVVRIDPGTGHKVLFYSEVDTSYSAGYPHFHTTLRRYDLNTLSALGGSIDLGTWVGSRCSPGEYHFQGWDASPDGTHVVYQVITSIVPAPVPNQDNCLGQITASTIYAANADGSGASAIVQYLYTLYLVRMRVSPNSQAVAVTEAYGTPDVVSGCLNSAGKKGDPCLHFYSPNSGQIPAWWWNSSSFVATAGEHFPAMPVGSGLYHFTPGTVNGVVYAAAGYNPWSTP